MQSMRYLYVLLLTCVIGACNGQQSSPTFEMISIPAQLKTPEERAEYLVKHYWDKFDFQDTTYIHAPQVTEQALANYLDLAKYVSPETMSASLKTTMGQAERNRAMFRYFSEMMEKYLYDPESPLRNEEMYITVLEHLTRSSSLNDVEKVRPAYQLELALKNRAGTPATDFAYTLADGRTDRLYRLEADYLLLFFYNPDCHTCQEISRQMEASFLIQDFLGDKRLTILAVYPEEDQEAWKAHAPLMPKSWINAYDKSVSLKNDEIYDLKAMPTLYLLSKEKKVLLKDATLRQIERYLSETAN